MEDTAIGDGTARSAHVAVIGGGIAGLAAVEQLTRTNPAIRVTLLEASDRLGGHIRTEVVEGLTVEAGPDVLLSAKPAAVELARRVGLGDRIVGTAVRGAYVLTKRGLVRLPDGLTGLVPSRIDTFLGTSLISPIGKLRVLAEYFLRPPREDLDESVERFFVRRLGREMYEKLAEPLLGGIAGGDGAKLSVKAMFPQLHAIERHGGFVRSMLDHAVVSEEQVDLFAEEPRPFVSFSGGMGELVEGVVAAIRERDLSGERIALRTGTATKDVRLEGSGLRGAGGDASPRFALTLEGGETLRADAVIVATPAYAAAAMLGGIDGSLARLLSRIAYNSTATVTLAYPISVVGRKLDATGYVTQRSLNRPVMACTWSSAKFAGRAPEDRALFRLFFGSDRAAAPSATLVQHARGEMLEILATAGDPIYKRVDRFHRSMPQYQVGHLDRIQQIEKRTHEIPCLYLAGSAYRGVGISDSVNSGMHAAAGVTRDLARTEGKAG